MFLLAQFFGILVIISNVIAMQMKKKKQIIFMYILVNLFAVINFLLLNSYSGALICFFAILQSLINNYFEKNNKKVPKILVCLYIIISILCGLLTYKNYFDIIPIICSILYSLIIVQSKEKNIRKISLLNILLWIIYDFSCMAYTAVISDIITAISTVIGMYRFDYKRKKKKYKKK